MAFDVQRGVVVLFGGVGRPFGQQTELGDTWEWNGSYWFEHFQVPGPSPRRLPGLIYDVQHGRTLLFGGIEGGTFQNANDTWEWDGMSWTQLAPTGSLPPGGPSTDFVFDTARGVGVLVQAGQTWELTFQPVVAASYSQFGQGCAGPVGVPDLAAASGSLPRIGATFSVQMTNLPATILNLPFGVIGFNATTWNGQPLPVSLGPFGFTGCQAWIAPRYSEVLANSGGVANWSFPIPLSLQLAGADFYLQGAVTVPGWNPGGMIFSNAGHGIVGTP